MKRFWRLHVIGLSFTAGLVAAALAVPPQQRPNLQTFREQSRLWSVGRENQGLAEAFLGITTNGNVVSDLFRNTFYRRVDRTGA